MILPIIILLGDGLALFPTTTLSLALREKESILAAEQALKNNPPVIGLFYSEEAIFAVGGMGTITEWSKNSDEEMHIVIGCLARIKIAKYIQREPYRAAQVLELRDEPAENNGDNQELEDLMIKIRNEVNQNARYLTVANYQIIMLTETNEPGPLADLIAFSFLKGDESYDILQTLNLKERLKKAAAYLWPKIAEMKMRGETEDEIDVRQKQIMEEQRKQSYLRDRLQTIQGMLNGGQSDTEKHRKKIEEACLPSEAKEEALETLEHLARLRHESAEYGYLEA